MIMSASDLKSKVTGTVVVPGDDGYEASLRRWAANAERKAGVVVLPENTSDVAAAVTSRKTCIMTDGQLDFAKKAGMEVAISGGGHSASGASSSEGGLVIDLRQMRQGRVDTSTNRVAAQGGCLWIDVEQALAEHKLATGERNNGGLCGLMI